MSAQFFMLRCTRPGAAVKMFEELEAWDALVLCYRLLEKKPLAEEIIQRRLKVRKQLFC